ncbi:beta-1,6-N-acetylglucosaminyltransferase [Nostoc sp. 106C]|uniref:beta-1,6-N-acetylglucosaminyltransferase n=1 Tax=Nostoc sp. 106C TaxID=1932667 RepID=UPI000A3B420E|nr:beta-1,6-N-acetylglucosaminyltransferase [Nostoc sp. 106C]OUL26834.1 hypothetical protein BV375_20480 [Nostoc sp. 106C]
MKIAYLIQSHKNPKQIYRLVKTITQSSPNSYVLVSHDFKSCNLDITPLQQLPEVQVINGQGGRGDFSIVQGYLDAVNWLLSHHIEFDWLINITGQDYPTQPLPKIEKFLAETKYDGFSCYFDALSDSEQNPWERRRREGSDRYLYQYWRSGGYLSLWQRALIKFPRIVINNTQPFIRINSSYGLMVGIRAVSPPFNDKFLCYAGSNFHTLSRKCVHYLHEFSNRNAQFRNYYQKSCIPDESYIQTILVNNGLLKIFNHNKRYMNFNDTQNGHPNIITLNDYSALIKEEIHFARKFDLEQDSKILDMLDKRVIKSC